MEKKTILFFIYQMGGGGAARTILNILNNMDKTKFKPILVTLDYNGNYEGHLDADVEFVKLDAKRLRSAIFPLAKLIRQKKADIVFSTIPNYNTIAILARLLSFTRGKNIVREAACLGGNRFTNLKLIAYGLLYRMASRIISLSEGVKENLIERYKVNPDKIKVIYNPVDIETIHDQIKYGQIAEFHKPIFESDAKTIITAGRLVEDKDHRTLLEAFARVNKKVKSQLIILGEGKLESSLKAQAKKLDLEDNIHFIGFQNNPYIYFNRADLFVLSSTSEGFGHVLAEALAAGTPVVSTNCKPGAEEVLNFGEYGTLCAVGNAGDMAEKIYEILTLDEAETNKIIQKGIQRANDFNAKSIVRQYENAFIHTTTGHKKQTERS